MLYVFVYKRILFITALSIMWPLSFTNIWRFVLKQDHRNTITHLIFHDGKYTVLQKSNSKVSGLNYTTAEYQTILGWVKTSNKREYDIQRAFRRLIKLLSSNNTLLAVFKNLTDCCEEMYIHFCFHFTAISLLHQELYCNDLCLYLCQG
jgi:hypothetical protein